MARLPYLDQAELAPEHRHLLARSINLHRALVHSPGAAAAFSTLGSYIRNKSPLDTRLREMAILQVGWVARSEYEWSHHIKIGHDFGVSDDDIAKLIAETDGQETDLDAPVRVALRAAREMYAGPGVSDATFSGLREYFDPELVIDLVVTIGFYVGVVRVLATMQIDVEPEYLPYLQRFPLPADQV
jgi:alkylhydroperoxidase family enzyme